MTHIISILLEYNMYTMYNVHGTCITKPNLFTYIVHNIAILYISVNIYNCL